jgi:hypothetical protein
MADTKWLRNDEAESMVAELVGTYHRHLDRAHIVCLTKPTASKKNGRTTWATCQKVTPLIRALLETETQADYVIVIAGPVWERLTTKERRALIDHELMHAAGYDDERETWLLDGHDVEEFAAIIERHGAWRPDLERFIGAAKKVVLPQMGLDEVTRAFTEHVETMRQQGITVEVSTGDSGKVATE